MRRLPHAMVDGRLDVSRPLSPSIALGIALTFLAFLLLGHRALRGSGIEPHAEQRVVTLMQDLEVASKSFRVVKDTPKFQHYGTVVEREVVYGRRDREGDSQDLRGTNDTSWFFDVWSRTKSMEVVISVPFDSTTRTFTMIREFSPAHGRAVFSFPSGVYEAAKHASLQDAAIHELNEEGRLLCTGVWERLNHNPFPQDKYQRESVTVFLCDTVAPAKHWEEREDEEKDIAIFSGIEPYTLRRLIMEGAVQANIAAAALMALLHLEQPISLPSDTV